jgi:hypothetical protein
MMNICSNRIFFAIIFYDKINHYKSYSTTKKTDTINVKRNVKCVLFEKVITPSNIF